MLRRLFRGTPSAEREIKFELVNSIEYFPETKEAYVYVKGKRHIVSNVLGVKWVPFVTPEEPLPVVGFKTRAADILPASTVVDFEPFVGVEYDPLLKELRIIWRERW